MKSIYGFYHQVVHKCKVVAAYFRNFLKGKNPRPSLEINNLFILKKKS